MPGYIYEKPSKPHWSELPPAYSELDMQYMIAKGERISLKFNKLIKKLKL